MFGCFDGIIICMDNNDYVSNNNDIKDNADLVVLMRISFTRALLNINMECPQIFSAEHSFHKQVD